MASAKRPSTLKDLAKRLGRSFEGPGDLVLKGVAALEEASESDLSYARESRYQPLVSKSRAGAIILPDAMEPGVHSVIRSPHPAHDFARAIALLIPDSPGELSGGVTAAEAHVAPSADVAAGVHLGLGSVVGARTILRPGVVIGAAVKIGEDCQLGSGVIIEDGSQLGDRVIIQPGAVIGSHGFGYLPDGDGRPVRMPHVGHVVIESEVEIGANTTIDRGTLHETRIRRGAKIDNQVQIAHNCDIGEYAMIAAQCGLSGSTRVGRRAILMGGVGSAGHLSIGEGAFVGARTGLHKDVPAGGRVYGHPQQPDWKWHRNVAALSRLPETIRRLRTIEQALGVKEADKLYPTARDDAESDQSEEK